MGLAVEERQTNWRWAQTKPKLRNLICNALRFTKHGEVRVADKFDALTGSHAAGEQCRLTAADTGIGIAPENQEAVAWQAAPIKAQGTSA